METSWPAPSLHYTAQYVRWQMSFGGDAEPSAVAAFHGDTPVGFAASTPRYVRCEGDVWTCAVVSFVCVLPAYRHQGVAAALYGTLLRAIRTARTPVLTFALSDSPGERALLRAYEKAGATVHDAGRYPTYTFLASGKSSGHAYEVEPADDPAVLAQIVRTCASSDASTYWHDPPSHHLALYFEDPRARRLLVAWRNGEPVAAAWALGMDYNTARSIERVPTLESVFISDRDPHALTEMANAAVRLLNPRIEPAIVNLPSLAGFDERELRASGVRRTGAGFNGYYCTWSRQTARVKNTNLEIV